VPAVRFPARGRKKAATLASGGGNPEILLLDLANAIAGLGLSWIYLEDVLLGVAYHVDASFLPNANTTVETTKRGARADAKMEGITIFAPQPAATVSVERSEAPGVEPG